MRHAEKETLIKFQTFSEVKLNGYMWRDIKISFRSIKSKPKRGKEQKRRQYDPLDIAGG
jgi:hypothetical protein